MRKEKNVNIRMTEETYDELKRWAERFNIKLGPFCLFIISEKIDHLKNYEKVFDGNDLKDFIEKIEEDILLPRNS